MEVSWYATSDGREPYGVWLATLRDQRARVAIVRRVRRIARDGHLGDHKYLRDGVSEMRVDIGPGYRVYFGRPDANSMLLLCGGDIGKAVDYWRDHQRRSST
ncbi:MAG TPA: type II toxin-antitoxin system RelE/ParE family toxin [Steroidobacteraceae bacterium]|nr:type II toxin-antitoxin system RelE/ParE family toxin [Steroidobacteraceae bacterium]HRX88207.1 type II toxin-antitoxin system RelE/ParE family toxin [Steroidobacteraceae bacterium]